MKSNLCHELLMPQGSHFSCFAKKSDQKKATPTFALIRDLKRKRRAVRNSLALKQRTASSTFSRQISGSNTRGPVEPMFDRFAMRFTEVSNLSGNYSAIAIA